MDMISRCGNFWWIRWFGWCLRCVTRGLYSLVGVSGIVGGSVEVDWISVGDVGVGNCVDFLIWSVTCSLKFLKPLVNRDVRLACDNWICCWVSNRQSSICRSISVKRWLLDVSMVLMRVLKDRSVCFSWMMVGSVDMSCVGELIDWSNYSSGGSALWDEHGWPDRLASEMWDGMEILLSLGGSFLVEWMDIESVSLWMGSGNSTVDVSSGEKRLLCWAPLESIKLILGEAPWETERYLVAWWQC